MLRKWLEKKCYPDHPRCATPEEWVEWEKKEKEKPICNFCVNIFPEWYKFNVVDRLRDIKLWFKYRFQKEYKYHLIDTGLEPGYHEIDDRMLHGMFNLLKEYCEYEMPYHDWICVESSNELHAEETGEKYKRSKFIRGYDAAMESFRWQKDLVYKEETIDDEDKNLIGQPTHQAKKATELETLYLWWVVTRPNRKDSFDTYPDPFFDKLFNEATSAMELFKKGTPEEEMERSKIYKLRADLEQKYQDEDEEMLIRLIKIRHTMWT